MRNFITKIKYLRKAKEIVIPPSHSVQSPQDKTQLRLRRLLQERQVADFYYFIDVVGTCNLRYPSCAVGNYPTPKGRMSLETYQAILDKISREHHDEKIFIDLFNWGEPGLHTQLGEIVRITEERGYGVGISTNLNIFTDMKAVIKAQPNYIRISLSGYYNETYQTTHRRGDINLVRSNMHQLRYMMNQLKSEAIVQVGFHVYRTNFDVDFWKMKTLCEDLGFMFAPTLAALMPAENAVKAIDGTLLGDETILEKLVVSPAERIKLLATVGTTSRDCQFRQIQTSINFDGSVPLCCATFEKEQIIAENFLDVSRAELQARKYKHSFCKTCMKHSLDMVYTCVGAEHVENHAVSVLGPKYKDFLESWNVSIDPVVEWRGKELTAQESFDLAAKYEMNSEPSTAKLLYQKLVLAFPRHGAAHFKLGQLSEKEGDHLQASHSFNSALNIWPSHQPYIDAAHRVSIKPPGAHSRNP